jgi:hypothetical protein
VSRKNLTLCSALVLALVGTSGCGAGSGRAPAETPEDAEAETKRLADSRAKFYGGTAPWAPLTAEEKALWDGMNAGLDRPCSHDSRLTRTARDHAAELVRAGRVGADGELDRLRFNFRKKGGTDYVIRPLAVRLDSAGKESLFSFVKAHGGDWSHCGLGVAGTGQTGFAVLIAVDRLADLDPLSISVEPGTPLTMRGRVLARTDTSVYAFVGNPDGSARQLRPAPISGDGRFKVRFVLSERGRHEIELMVDSGRGLETAVLLPLFVGVPPDKLPTVTPPGDDLDDGRSPGQVLFDLLGRARARAGLRPLKRDPALDRVARNHSEEMSASRFFGHVSPLRGTLGRRLARDGLSPVGSAENVARGGSLLRIHRNLMASPSHRINALGPGFTHVGIGVANVGEDLVATEIFARFE